MLHMFSSNIYTDFRTAYKHVLIPNYLSDYSSDLTEPKCHITSLYWQEKK